MSSENPEYYEHVFHLAVEKACVANEHYATLEETADLLGFKGGELEAMIHAILHITRWQVSQAVENDQLDDEDVPAMYDAICANTAASTMILLHALRKNESKKKTDASEKYPVTMLAEAHIRNMLADQADLNVVWPIPLAEEVVKEFDPTHAFMVGVVCGASNG
jgi:hypothetical protein